MDRSEYEFAVERSPLKRAGRDVCFALARRYNQRAGAILDQHTPSITDLQRATGMSRSGVCMGLTEAEKSGYLTRRRPPVDQQRRKHARTRYVLCIPPAEDPGQGAGLTGQPEQDRPGTAPAARIPPAYSAAGADLAEAVIEEMSAAGRVVTRDQAAEIARQILAGRAVAPESQGTYVRNSVRDNPAKWRPAAPAGRRPSAYCGQCRTNHPKGTPCPPRK